MQNKKILFYVKYPNENIPLNDRHEDFDFFYWTPKYFNRPTGFNFFPITIWILFHYFSIFKSKSFSLSCLYSHDKLVHQIIVFPAFFRFPFMGVNDIQFGDIWTLDSFQNKGIAKRNLNLLINKHSNKKIWFLCSEDNIASRKIAENSGFELFGVGYKSKRLINILSQYIISKN